MYACVCVLSHFTIQIINSRVSCCVFGVTRGTVLQAKQCHPQEIALYTQQTLKNKTQASHR